MSLTFDDHSIHNEEEGSTAKSEKAELVRAFHKGADESSDDWKLSKKSPNPVSGRSTHS